jgi:small subunit ribosomal protein S16
LVKIRLMRVGRLHRVSYRIVAADEQAQRDGKTLEMLGTYDPRAKDEAKQLEVHTDRVEYWLSLGAQPTPTVAKLLKKKGLRVVDVRAKVKAAAKAAKESRPAV